MWFKCHPERSVAKSKDLLLILVSLLLLCAHAFAADCRITSVQWQSEHEPYEETQVQALVGKSCESWPLTRERILDYYENRGFLAAHLEGSVDSAGVLSLKFSRGSAWVWADPENMDSSGSKLEVFRKQTGIVAGDLVSPQDLERSDMKLARLGYYNRTAPVQMFRDPVRNRIIPVYHMQAAAVSEAYALLTYSSETDVWEGNVNVALYNILGTARDLQIEGYTGDEARRLEGSYKEPWIFGTEWNVIARGYFDEDSSTRDAYGELGISRDIGFDFAVGVFLGVGSNRKTSTFELSYVSLDRFVLPRSGTRFDGSVVWNMDRPDSLDNYLKASAKFSRYLPLYGNWITRFSGAAGGIFPTDADLDRFDYFALGGMDSFKGMDVRFMRTRAYGYSEFALLWQDGYDLSIEAFYQPGLYRAFVPDHGWKREHDYGVAFTQYRGNWSVNLYYALRNGENYLDGIIGFGLKTLF
ncbi:Surface antigen [Fibrobacter sp. UWT2]|uniref:BamA/TamA family outer membrane protein n=1 Tax=Fibrobacter sp. UWT2 TaxID=1896224 RepID=UPI00091FE494|nr:BamA/TamA family outer membrane protein [Fibrobacter sp. UWT2]SHK41178.1 Surface antigen [Fibrobacter sp. UWT2]